MPEPLIGVVRGAPTDEELAALTVVLLSLLSGSGCASKSGPVREHATWRGAHARYRSPASWRHVPNAA